MLNATNQSHLDRPHGCLNRGAQIFMAIHSDKRMKRLFLYLIPPLLLAIATAGLAVAAGCPARQGPMTVTTGSSEFHVHAETARQRIRTHLSSQTTDPDGEAKWNVPFELRPTAPTTRAILLVHGLGIRRGPSPMSRAALRIRVMWCVRCCCPGMAPRLPT